jgi:hypothetical protein
MAELGGAVVEEKRQRRSSPSCMIKLRACWTTQPRSGFAVQATYSIRLVPDRDEEEDVDPLQKGCLDRGEVTGNNARRLRSQERSPGRVRSLRRRPEGCLEQDLAHRRRRNADAERPLSSPTIRLYSHRWY